PGVVSRVLAVVGGHALGEAFQEVGDLARVSHLPTADATHGRAWVRTRLERGTGYALGNDHRTVDERRLAVEHLPGRRRAGIARSNDRRGRPGAAVARRAPADAIPAHARAADPSPPRPRGRARQGARGSSRD